jgi:hypothetical protein
MSTPNFKAPPVIDCLSQARCLGIGRKTYNPYTVCLSCLKRHDPQQLRGWANNNASALALIEEQVNRKQEAKRRIEAHGRYLCAFEDPDFQHCRWRESDLNLRGTRLNCTTVRGKGKACKRCWRRHLQNVAIVQYFSPAGLCYEESDKIVEVAEEGDDDAEGYNVVFN